MHIPAPQSHVFFSADQYPNLFVTSRSLCQDGEQSAAPSSYGEIGRSTALPHLLDLFFRGANRWNIWHGIYINGIFFTNPAKLLGCRCQQSSRSWLLSMPKQNPLEDPQRQFKKKKLARPVAKQRTCRASCGQSWALNICHCVAYCACSVSLHFYTKCIHAWIWLYMYLSDDLC